MSVAASQNGAHRKLVKTGTPGVYKRGNRYAVVVSLGGGKQVKRSARTLAEARDLRSQLRADVTRGEYRTTSNVTFAEHAPRWIESYGGRTSRGIEDHTRNDYRKRLEADAIPFFGRMKLAAIEPRHIKEFAVHVAARGVSAATVKLALAPVKCLLADAAEEGVIRSNPSAGIRIALPTLPVKAADSDEFEADEGEVKRLTDDELAAFLDHVPGEWRLFFEFLSETGLRIGEAIEARFRDVDATTRTLHVRRRFYRGKVGKPKGRKTRRVRLSVAMVAALEALRVERGGDPDALLFTSERGSRIDQSNLMSRVLKPTAKAAGIGEWPGFHTFRHTCASRLFVAGWNAVQVQKFLGHSDPGFTLRTYVHLLPEDMPEVPYGNVAEVVPLHAVA